MRGRLALLSPCQRSVTQLADLNPFLTVTASLRLFGGGSQAQAQDVPAPVAAQAANQIADQGAQCAVQAKSFTQCLDATGSDMGSCAYYFGASFAKPELGDRRCCDSALTLARRPSLLPAIDALKACQAAAAQY